MIHNLLVNVAISEFILHISNGLFNVFRMWITRIWIGLHIWLCYPYTSHVLDVCNFNKDGSVFFELIPLSVHARIHIKNAVRP